MQFLRVLWLVGVAAIASPQRTWGPDMVPVLRVADGNTVHVGYYGRVRLSGVRAPKLSGRGLEAEPHAREARDRLEGIVGHRFVRLEFPAASASSAYVLLDDGTFVNARLVEEGLARVSGRPMGERGDALRRAQERAQAARLGIWRAR